jgi:hypothetical protein
MPLDGWLGGWVVGWLGGLAGVDDIEEAPHPYHVELTQEA